MPKYFSSVIFISAALLVSCATTKPVTQNILESAKEPVQESSAKKNTAVEDIPSYEENLPFKEVNGISEYKIGAEDILRISVWKKDKADVYEVEIKADGKITLLFLEDIKVSGYTATEADEIITNKLKEFFKNPRIDISVKEYKNKKVYISGEVNGAVKGGAYILRGKTTLTDLIFSSGGPSNDADLSEIKINRSGKTYMVNLLKTILNNNNDKELLIEDKDLIIVPSKKEKEGGEKLVYVIGEVMRPGLLKYNGELGIVNAITMAGGYTDSAISKDIKIIRGDIKNPAILSSNLERYFKNMDTAQNIVIENGDIIYVPPTAIKNVANFFKNIQPILQALLYPGLFRDLYTTGGGLRIDTGERDTSNTTILPSR